MIRAAMLTRASAMAASTTGGASLALNISDDGLFAVHMSGKDLVIHSNFASDNKEVQTTRLKEPPKSIRLCPFRSSAGASEHRRHLIASNDTRISVWQLDPLQSVAEIESVEPGVLNVEFGGDENEVLVFHAWSTKMSIYSLITGLTSVIKSPKTAHSLGFGYRPRTGEFAILLKPEASDLLTIHQRESYEIVNRTVLPTIDAQGLKWSPDGRWIAVWDVASAGTKILIFTSDGQLFRTYNGPPGVENEFDLGVKQIEWSPVTGPSGTSETLAVGKVNGNVDLLRTRTFSSSTTLSHVFQVDQHPPTIWRERFTSALGDADYAETSASSAFNMSPESSGISKGVSALEFSPDGNLLATVNSTRSNVVWIWALDAPPRLASALVHEQPVRQIAWHSATPQLLINTVTNMLPSVRWWSPQSHPVIARVPTPKTDSGKYEVKWLTGTNPDSIFWFGSTEEYVVGYLSAEEGIVQFEVLHSVVNRGDAGKMSR